MTRCNSVNERYGDFATVTIAEMRISRTFRAFVILYAGAMIAVDVGSYVRIHFDYTGVFFSIGSTTLCYLALALGYLGGNDREKTPTRPWLAILYALTLCLPVSALLWETPTSWNTVGPAAIMTASILAYLALTTLLLLDFQSERSMRWSRIRSGFVPASLVVGAGLVVSSVFLKVTYDGSGWAVITRKAAWITTGINVGTNLFGPTIDWLQPIYAPGGYAVYVLSLAATVMLLMWLPASRMSVERMQASSVIAWLAGLISLASLWVLTDIFFGWWGFQCDLSSTPWAAIVATCLWLAAPLFGAFLLAPIVRGKREVWRLRALLIFQLPMAAFNVLMLQAYYGTKNLDIPGLGILIIGLQLESWACTDLLILRTKTKPVPDPVLPGSRAI